MIIEILMYTPKWVFGLLVFLIVLGLQQTRNRTVKKPVILLLPIGMAVLSFVGVAQSFGLLPMPIALWLMAIIATSFLVATQFPLTGVAFNSDAQKLHIPGSWVPLVLIMAIFCTKYIVGVISALQPAFVASPVFMMTCSLVYGALSGIFVGRAVSMWKVSKVTSDK